jgi:hypothetical protein
MHSSARSLSAGRPRVPGPTAAQVHDLTDLRVGDVVEVRRWDTVHFHGAVDVVCPRLGVLWVLDGPLRERTLVHAGEYSLWRTGRPVRAR